MGNCKSCIKSKTSDDLDRHSQGRRSFSEIPQPQAEEASNGLNRRASSRASRKSIGSAAGNKENQSSPSTAGRDVAPPSFQPDKADESSNLNRRASSKASRKSIGSAAGNKENQSTSTAGRGVAPPSFQPDKADESSNNLSRRASTRASHNSIAFGSAQTKGFIINVLPAEGDEYQGGGKRLIEELRRKNRISDFTDICSILWKEDDHSIVFNKDYKFSRQYGLQCFLDDQFFASNPTYNAFSKLLKLYNDGAVFSFSRQTAQDEFLDAVLEKRVMKICWAYLNYDNYFSKDRNDFKNTLRAIWFPNAFEHIFVGSCDGDGVNGLHNWIQYSLEQKKGRIEYLKCHKQIQRMMIVIQYKWNGEMKDFGSMFIGTSPEFEFALYTLLYFQSLRHIQPETTYKLVFEGMGKKHEAIQVKVIIEIRDRSLKTAYPVRP